MVYCIETNTKMFEITVPIWGPMSAFLVFENLLVRYLGQKFSKLSFFNHIWSHLPGVNGFLLEPFMTCNNFCHSLWRILATRCNGVDECIDGIDEAGCQNDDIIGLIMICIMFLAIIVMWIATHLKFAGNDDSRESIFDPNWIDAKGDKLSGFKVSFKKWRIILILTLLFFRIKQILLI